MFVCVVGSSAIRIHSVLVIVRGEGGGCRGEGEERVREGRGGRKGEWEIDVLIDGAVLGCVVWRFDCVFVAAVGS